ncbi:MAG TPA: SRPBCC family protein [Candidatus Limnocylindria bacterium]|nr:SRPBCC family protein [Candidatus Limnocylindria bacterium]
MQRVDGSARIPAPPDEVFAYLADLDNVAEWQGGVTDARRTSEGPMGIGSTAIVVRNLMGQRLEAPLMVNEFDPPRRLGIGSEVSGVKAQAVLTLAPADEAHATDLAFSMEIRGSGFTSFMEPMIASAARGDIAASLERVRARFAASTDAA